MPPQLFTQSASVVQEIAGLAGKHELLVVPVQNVVAPLQTTRSANAEQLVPPQLLDTPLNGEAQFVVAEQLKSGELGGGGSTMFSYVPRDCCSSP
jgi:hypothetical protein